MSHLLYFFVACCSHFLGSPSHEAEIPSGFVYMVRHPLGNSKWRFAVTDGHFYIQSTSDGHSVTDCFINEDKEFIHSVAEAPEAEKPYLDESTFKEMVDNCIHTQLKSYYKTKTGNKRDSNSSDKPFAPEKTGQPEGGLGVGIFPGTKWCGLGNDASSYDDLGTFNATDACCREHDHCPYFIDHFETKYNYENPYPWTLSHCDCDNKLYNCLKQANTSASDEVGKLFFGLLNVHCFTFQEGEYCVKRHWSGLYCEEKGYGEKAVTKTFPHQWGEDIIG